MVRRKFGPLAQSASRHGLRRGGSAGFSQLLQGVAVRRERVMPGGSADAHGMLDLEALSHAFCPSQVSGYGAPGSDDRAHVDARRYAPKPAEIEQHYFKEHINTTIERDIIPRLMVTYAMHDSRPAAEPERQKALVGTPVVADYERLAMEAVLEDASVLRARLDELVNNGMPLTEVFLSLMAPAARHLGHLWTLDAIDFSSVAIGLMRLQQLVHSYGDVFSTPSCRADRALRRALLVPAPGEHHTFGLVMIGDFLRRAGWQTLILPSFGRDEMIATIQSETFDVVGVSVGNDGSFDDVRGLLKHVRKAARKRELGILVGGNAINGEMEKVVYLGADATTIDGRHVAAEAAKLVDSRSNRC